MSHSKNYDKFTPEEHVRKRPDSYIGCVDVCDEVRWVYDSDEVKMVRKQVRYNPGLEQCVMELITNATDRTQNPKLNVSKITVNVTDSAIEIMNDGTGVPIEIHDKFKIYLPELIFGNMLSGSNLKDGKEIKRTVGGKNGIGAKAANLFSNSFTVITVFQKQKYIQVFTNQMRQKSTPKITKTKEKDYTKIIFEPCLKAFSMQHLHENDTITLIQKRTIDASAVTPKKVSVYYNKKKIPVKDFQDYMNLYIGNKSKTPRVYLDKFERWTIGFALNPYPSSVQVSFVNGIGTEEGGTHVNHILEPVLNRVVKELQEKHKNLSIRKQYIRDNIIVFVKAVIENPTFTSQTKRCHTTQVNKFGSRVILTDDAIKKITKLGITRGILEIARAKELKDLNKTDGKKKIRLIDIPKLDDANWAGTKKSHLCTLILCEGDSAKSTALAGLSVVGKDKYGVFPLKGKLLNTRDGSPTQINKNVEITNIKKILGLKNEETYENGVKNLRYGKVMIMCDCDLDGFHIKGLLFNYFSCFWPKLLGHNFTCSLLTPIVKVFKGTQIVNFYDLYDYENWKTNLNEGEVKKWRVKYYKGLGTSTSKEAKEYFTNILQNQINYTFNPEENSSDTQALKLAFTASKKVNTDKRKKWITQKLINKPKVDYTIKTVSINNFVNNELVQFSIYDNQRSIPHVLDGFKISQRKILYSCLKRKLFIKNDGSGEIKVVQLAGYVSEHSGYHHGEASLQGAIVNMAQNFVGAGNANILYPSGQFGTRVNGKDSASPRYIFTYLNNWVKDVFNETDNLLLNYLDDDGTSIEPDFYIPVIPMLLVNGSEGIGTGWSTNIPCFNPKDIVHNLKKLIDDEESNINIMHPWYKGFKGKITQINDKEWITKGIVKILPKRGNEVEIEVTELPISTTNSGHRWIQNFKDYLCKLEQNNTILSFVENYTDEKIYFKVRFRYKDVKGLDNNDILEKLKLIGTIKTSNMHAFDSNGEIKKYQSAEEILWEFFQYRKLFYVKRKKYLIHSINKLLITIQEKFRFIKMVIDKNIKIFKKSKIEIKQQLQHNKFKKINHSYDHLLGIKLHAFTLEKLNELKNKINNTTNELNVLENKHINDMWKEDLDSTKFISDLSSI
jgi:DNA topoisomerase II